MNKKVISSLVAIVISLASTAFAGDKQYYHNDFWSNAGNLDLHTKVKLSMKKMPPVNKGKHQDFVISNTNAANVVAVSNFSSRKSQNLINIDTTALGAQISIDGNLKGGYYSTNNNFGNVVSLSNVKLGKSNRTNVTTTAIGAITSIIVTPKSK